MPFFCDKLRQHILLIHTLQSLTNGDRSIIVHIIKSFVSNKLFEKPWLVSGFVRGNIFWYYIAIAIYISLKIIAYVQKYIFTPDYLANEVNEWRSIIIILSLLLCTNAQRMMLHKPYHLSCIHSLHYLIW